MSAPVETSQRLRPWLRGLLIGPLSLVAACLTMVGAAVWLPEGRAHINNLILPVVLFPLLWTAFLLYACLDKKLARAYAVIGVLVLANVALVTRHLLG
jgi:hypothetical protein